MKRSDKPLINDTSELRRYIWEETTQDMWEPSFTYRTYNGYVSYGMDPSRSDDKMYAVAYNVDVKDNCDPEYLEDVHIFGHYRTLNKAKIVANIILMPKLGDEIKSFIVANQFKNDKKIK